MLDQMFESFRKVSESSLQIQQDAFRYWTQQWNSASNQGGTSNEWTKTVQKRWLELLMAYLTQQRESLDAAHRAGIQVIEKTLKVWDAKSPEDYRHVMEELWRNLFETFKAQSETQYREFQKWSEKSFEMAQAAQA